MSSNRTETRTLRLFHDYSCDN